MVYAPALAYFQQDPWSKTPNHTGAASQAVHHWQNGPPFSDEFDDIVNNASGAVDAAHPGLTNFMPNLSRLPQEERVYSRTRGESGFELSIGLE